MTTKTHSAKSSTLTQPMAHIIWNNGGEIQKITTNDTEAEMALSEGLAVTVNATTEEVMEELALTPPSDVMDEATWHRLAPIVMKELMGGGGLRSQAIKTAISDTLENQKEENQMKAPITISFDRYQEDQAPLFAHYQGQILPQPAYVTLDLETGEVDARVSGEIGNAMPADVWHGIRRRYPINNLLSRDQVVEVLEGARETLQTIFDNGEALHDGSNWIGRLNEVGEDAERNMPEILGMDVDGRVIPNLKEWLTDSGDEHSWLPETNENIPDFIQAIREDIKAEDWVTGDNIEDALKDLWADRLYGGDPLPQNVAQFLLDDGHCDDSQWVSELEAYSEGRDPDDDDAENEGITLN